MKVRYLYSASVVIETADTRILCDPWFTPGAYDGAWRQYPPMDDPVAKIGPVDLIYISHIHPDHYDPAFLRRYLKVYSQARLIIGPQKTPHLARKMAVDGFKPEIAERFSMGGTDLLIIANDEGDGRPSEIDSALVVRADGRTVVNMNDNPFSEAQVEHILAFCPDRRVDFALLPYAGAGPYPQTFAFSTEEDLRVAGARKREQFLALFDRYMAALRPVKAMPFAGKYWLCGTLAPLNRHRGVADAMEVKARHADNVVVLADGGGATYDLGTQTASAERTDPYDPDAVDAYLAALPDTTLHYERELRPLPGHALPLAPLLATAKRRARSRIAPDDPYWLILRPSEGGVFIFNLADDDAPKITAPSTSFESLTPRLEIEIDARLLFGLLTRLYHWNNAEIGSHYRSTRVPGDYLPHVYRFLDYLQV